ncbi:MAG: hypothetical protein JW924_11935 [Fusobacteriaceae bacterium]|nr:hypothetical protein [Fusobacteriaceae bacterium]
MNFKTMLEEDLIVFFDADTLADVHIVEGLKLTCFLSDENYSKKNENYVNFNESKVLTIKESDYKLIKSPRFNSEIIVDSKVYTVTNIKLEKGVITLKLSGEDT